jgi:hypothetical protein
LAQQRGDDQARFFCGASACFLDRATGAERRRLTAGDGKIIRYGGRRESS